MDTTEQDRTDELAVQRHRRAKAERLAGVLIDAGADGTEEFDGVTWQLAHRAAGVNAPSALTRDLAMWIVRDRKVRP